MGQFVHVTEVQPINCCSGNAPCYFFIEYHCSKLNNSHGVCTAMTAQLVAHLHWSRLSPCSWLIADIIPQLTGGWLVHNLMRWIRDGLINCWAQHGLYLTTICPHPCGHMQSSPRAPPSSFGACLSWHCSCEPGMVFGHF